MRKMTHTEGHRVTLFITIKSGEHDDRTKCIESRRSSPRKRRKRNEKDVHTPRKIFRVFALNEESEVQNTHTEYDLLCKNGGGVRVRACECVCVRTCACG